MMVGETNIAMDAAPSHAASSPFAISMQHGAKQRQTRRTAPHQADDCIDLVGFWKSEPNVTRQVHAERKRAA